MLRTFRSRLLLASIATFAVMLALLQWNAQRQLGAALEQSLHAQGELARPLLAAAIAPLLASRDHATLQELVRRSVGPQGLAGIEVLDSRGERVAGAAMHAVPGQPPLTVPLELAGQRYGEARLWLHTELMTEARRRLVRDGLVIGAVVLAAGTLLLALALAVLSQGAARLVQASRRIAGGDLTVQLPVSGAAEVRDVAEAFNRMSQALQAQMQALRDGEQRLRSVVAALSEGLLVQDASGRVTECNEAAARALGVTRAQLLNSNTFEPAVRLRDASGRELAVEEHPVVRTLRSGQPQRDVLLQVARAHGGTGWAQINCEPILDASGAPVTVVSTVTDVTRHVQAEETLRLANQTLEQRVAERTAELARAKDAAEQANRAKSEFLSRMSHELRTPLNAILGFAQLMALPSSGLGSAERRQLEQIETAGWHLLELIDEVLDLARIEAGAMAVTPEPLDVGELAARALEMAAPLAARHGVTLQGLAPQAAALRVQADRRRLLQVLNNLLSNGIKYNRPQGRVALAARQDGECVELTVSDTGRGLTPAQLARLYVPFTRFESGDEAIQGTGIGLVITRSLVELMGGTLDVASQPAQGSTFTVRLPAATAASAGVPPPPSAPASATAPAGRPQRVVYLEDNPSNVRLVAEVLAQRPALQLATAGDGACGLALLRAQPPDLALIDIDLPGIDGLAVCRALKADPVTRAIPLLALTAQAMPADQQRMRAAGFDAIMTKPLDIARFLAEVDRLLRAAPGP